MCVSGACALVSRERPCISWDMRCVPVLWRAKCVVWHVTKCKNEKKENTCSSRIATVVYMYRPDARRAIGFAINCTWTGGRTWIVVERK